MDVLTLALTCSLYQDAELVRVLITDASHGNPYFVGDTVKLETYDKSSSLQDAQQIIRNLERAGGRAAVGLMGLPISWAARFGKQPADLFEGCTNVSVGTAMLRQFEKQCREALEPAPRRKSRRRPRPPLSLELLRPCVLGHFGRELGIEKFVDGIMTELPRRDRAGAPAGAGAQPALTSPPPGWSGPGLFFEVTGSSPEPDPPEPAKVGRDTDPASGGAAAVPR